jgi:hypothetical protein
MSKMIDMSVPEVAMIIDRGGEYISTWTLPGTGALTGLIEIVVEARGSSVNVASFTGAIIDAALRKVRFTFPSSVTASLPTKPMIFTCKHTIGAATVIIAKGSFTVKGGAL